MSPGGRGLRLLTLNVNGLGSAGKATALLHFLHTSCGDPDIVCLQEVKLADAELLTAALQAGRGPGLPFHSRHYYNPGSANARGVAILVRNNPAFLNLPAAASAVDGEGRIIRIDLDCMHHALSVLCVYAPCVSSERGPFFDGLLNFIPPGRVLLLGGDLNCICDDVADQSLTNGRHRLVGSSRLQVLMQQHTLTDAFRAKHPQAREFTHFGTHGISGARLDRWLVADACIPWVQAAGHAFGAPGDHAGAFLHVLPPDLPAIGPGRWRFPTHVLHAVDLFEALKGKLTAFLQTLPAADGDTGQYARWLLIKDFIRDTATAIDKGHRRAEHRQRFAIEARLRSAVTALGAASAAGALHDNARREFLAANAALKEVMYAGSAHVRDSAAAMWRASGERCTAMHFSMGGRPDAPAPLEELHDKRGGVHRMRDVVSGLDLHDLVCEHFSSDRPSGLYRIEPTDPACQAELLSCVDGTLDAGLAAAAEGPVEDGSVTTSCLARALADSDNGKAPGRDGLPFEVFKSLWDVLCLPLCAAVNDVFFNDVAGEEWAEGIILPFYKGKGLPAEQLSSYRPITLLNCDFKLVARVIANRMQLPLESVVDPSQTAFIKGRWIGDNVLLQQGLMEELDHAQFPGVMLFLDVAKAYDRVDRSWLLRCATSLGFPQSLRTWMHRLIDGTRSRVCINGWLTHDFPVANGLPQGSPLSPLLWVLQLQPLTAALRKAVREGRLRTPLWADGKSAPPALHHADDTKLFVRDLAVDGPVAWGIVGKYCRASNALIHPDKSEGICMGSHVAVHGKDPISRADFGQPGDAPRIALGVPSTTDLSVAAACVYSKRIRALHLVAHLWGMHPLSAVGRCLMAKQVMANTVSYHATFVPPPAATVTAMQAIIARYVARSRLPEDATLVSHGVPAVLPKAAIACLPRHLGGMSMPDLRNHVVALQSKIFASLFSPGLQEWKPLMLRALARAAPHPNWGPAWVLTGLPIQLCAGLSSRMLALVSSFRAALPGPVQPTRDGEYPVRAWLLEPLYFNPRVHGVDGRPIPAPSLPTTSDWPFTLGQLARCSPLLQAHPDITALTARLPTYMREALDTARLGPQALTAADEWWSVAGMPVLVKHRSLGSRELSYFEVLQCGVLHAIPPPVGRQTAPWMPACVLQVFTPKYRWTPDELAAFTAAPLSDRDALRPLEFRLLGEWAAISVYPPAWGHGSTPLHLYSTKTTRLRLTLLAAADNLVQHMPNYCPGKALRPRLWLDPAHPSSSHLSSIEAEWTRGVRGSGGAHAPDPGPAWLQPRSPELQQRLSRHIRGGVAASRLPAPAPPLVVQQRRQQPQHALTQAPVARVAAGVAVADVVAAFWNRLWHAPVSNNVKVFAYRLAHAGLPCAAMKAFKRGNGVASAFCALCPAGGPRRSRPLETYTHLFLDCPAYRPAVEWLLDLWRVVAGHRPPMDAAVIIADDLQGWPHAPTGPEAALWSALRMTVLYSIWWARMSADAHQQSAAAVVRSAIALLRGEMRLQFNRRVLEASLSSSVPVELLRVRAPVAGRSAFDEIWAGSGLCRVVTDGAPGGGSRLVVLLTADSPVVAPD